MKPETLELYAKYARKYGFDIISVGDTGAQFKEYDGDGFIRHKVTLATIRKSLIVEQETN